MFSLVITVISIALVAVLAAAAVYYGGSALTLAGTEAEAARVINDGQQLSGAISLYKAAEGTEVSDLSVLVNKDYLKSLPGGAWQVVEGGVARTDLTENQCIAANKKLGISTVPSCTDPAYAGLEVCCTAE